MRNKCKHILEHPPDKDDLKELKEIRWLLVSPSVTIYFLPCYIRKAPVTGSASDSGIYPSLFRKQVEIGHE